MHDPGNVFVPGDRKRILDRVCVPHFPDRPWRNPPVAVVRADYGGRRPAGRGGLVCQEAPENAGPVGTVPQELPERIPWLDAGAQVPCLAPGIYHNHGVNPGRTPEY